LSSNADAVAAPTWGAFSKFFNCVFCNSSTRSGKYFQLGVALSMDIPLAVGPIFYLGITTAAVQYTIPQAEW